MKRLFILLIVILLSMTNALEAQNAGLRFHSINNVGLLEGGSDENLQLQTINGFLFKGFFGGIGIGLDNYYLKSVPLFVDVRKNIFDRRYTPFLYADAGAVFPWNRNTETQWSKDQYKTGFIYEGGIGYSLPVKGRFSMNFSAGYSQRFLKATTQNNRYYLTDNMPFAPMPATFDTVYNRYNFNRFSFKVGFSF